MMQIVAGTGLPQPTPSTAPQPSVVVGPAAPTAPIEPARRVSGSRDGGRADLQGQKRAPHATPARGRLIDLFI